MITVERLHELFEYRDGFLYRKIATSSKCKVGSIAGSKRNDGYDHVGIDYKTYQLHRMIFLYHHGYLPKEVDHIDNNPSNNKIENLRAATREQNTRNALLRKDNKSGVKGVIKQSNKWRAYITVGKEQKTIGRFESKEDAAKAINEARNKLHGEFANHGA